VRLVAQGGEQLVQLEMTKGQVLEEMGVNLLGVHSGARDPQANCNLRVVEQQGCISKGQSQVDSHEDLSDLSRGGAQTIQSGATSAGKAFAASLTPEPLDASGTTLAVTDQGMESGIGVAVIIAFRVGASVSGRTDDLTLATRAFALAPRADIRLAHIAPEKRGMRTSTHRAIVGGRGLSGRGALRWGDDSEATTAG